jgi:hypothetical protein
VFSAQVLSIPFKGFPFQFKISLGWLLSAFYYFKLFGVYPICSALNLIVSIESAKSINYQLCGKTVSQKRGILILKKHFPKPVHRLPESSVQSKVFPEPVYLKAILIFRVGPHRQNPQTDTRAWPV